jgi:superfamily I DNA/RNA helicase
MKNFFNKSAKAWQSYISYEFINGIELSESQKRVVNTESNQIIINGSAGSGKSIVLLYKLIKSLLEEKEPKRFLYISYNQTLIDDTLKRARMFNEFLNLSKRHGIVQICTFHSFASNLLKDMGHREMENIKMDYSSMERIRGNAFRRISSILYKYKEGGEFYGEIVEDERLFKSHDDSFVRDEILWMKANGFITLESYLECERAGRGNTPRLLKNQRKTIFKVFYEYDGAARERKWNQTNIDLEDYALILLKKFEEIPEEKKYDYIFVDEVQDFDAMQLKLLAMFSPKSLIIAGDPKQKIYKRAPHSYADLGIDVKTNSKVLNENFRSTEEIMNLANSLKFTDIIKDSSRVKYVNKGEKPKILFFNNWSKALEDLGKKIKKIQAEEPQATIALISREEAAKAAGNSSDLRPDLRTVVFYKTQ